MELELHDLTRIIRQRWSWVLLPAVICPLIAALLCFFVLPPMYQSTVTLLVQPQNTVGGAQIAYNDVLLGQRLAKTYGEILTSRQIADEVVRTQSLPYSSETLLDRIQVKADEESLLTAVTVRDERPERAAAIANGIADAFAGQLGKIMKVDRVVILDRAVVADDQKPVSPNKSLIIGATLVFGILLGTGLAFLRERLDRTVKEEEEIEDWLGLPVVGVIAKTKSMPVAAGAEDQLEGSVILDETKTHPQDQDEDRPPVVPE